MIVRVRLFAGVRDTIGRDVVDVTVPAGATVADLRRQLVADWPNAGRLLERSAVAVDAEYAEESRPLRPSAEVAIIPPVSGGQEHLWADSNYTNPMR